MFDSLSKVGKYLGQTAKLMVGTFGYDNYVHHMKLTHPKQLPMFDKVFLKSTRRKKSMAKAVFNIANN
ncbi:hypothetical protein A9G42_01380 [Gilliamella sp. Nev6-6]|uniref:CstA-like transporter-associated (seleno)protein n=1 Tax=Gilliamella sp. Nev6-6 TaxID=3120252 RepID=UPI00080F4744|nr:hypothetical protein A9G42_01380 [Gilliamella apicola]